MRKECKIHKVQKKRQNCKILEMPVCIPLSSREWDAAGKKIKWQRLGLCNSLVISLQHQRIEKGF